MILWCKLNHSLNNDLQVIFFSLLRFFFLIKKICYYQKKTKNSVLVDSYFILIFIIIILSSFKSYYFFVNMPSYYIGLKIQGAPTHHVTLSFLGDKSNSVIDDIIKLINSQLGEFKCVDIILDDFDMFGPDKDLKVRLCHFDTSKESGKNIHNLASQLYEEYGNHDYPQRFHISTNGSLDDELICNSKVLQGCQVYIKATKSSEHVYSNPKSY